MKQITLRAGVSVSLKSTENDLRSRMERAFAIVSPDVWGKADWKEGITAVLSAKDLEAADVTIVDVSEAIEFFTATEAAIHQTTWALDGEAGFVVRAKGYRAGPAN